MGTALHVVQTYYEAFDNHRDGWQDLVSDNVSFKGPLQKANGKREFVALTSQFLQFHQETILLKRFEEGDSVCSICESVVNTPSGKPITISYAEWARVSNGRVSEFRVYYDPREFAKAFGM